MTCGKACYCCSHLRDGPRLTGSSRSTANADGDGGACYHYLDVKYRTFASSSRDYGVTHFYFIDSSANEFTIDADYAVNGASTAGFDCHPSSACCCVCGIGDSNPATNALRCSSCGLTDYQHLSADLSSSLGLIAHVQAYFDYIAIGSYCLSCSLGTKGYS